MIGNFIKNKTLYAYILLAIFVVSLFGWFSIKMVKSLTEVKETQIRQHTEQIQTRQFLLSTIDWKTNRQKMILFMRDQIVNRWQQVGVKVDYNKAYRIAETNMIESEKYPQLDAILVLAVEKVESAFNERAVSPMGAIGIMQMIPTTGRLMASCFQLEYNDSTLYNLETNIKFGCKYLDVLHADFKDIGALLAGYNGGPYQSIYYLKDKSRLDPETRAFVPDVKSIYEEYLNNYESYKIDKIMSSDSVVTHAEKPVKKNVAKRSKPHYKKPKNTAVVPVATDSTQSIPIILDSADIIR